MSGVKILSATVSEKAGRWYVSVNVEEDREVPVNNGSYAGVDLGVNALATVSDGTIFDNPKALNFYERRMRRVQRTLSRKQKGSNNRKKVVRLLQTIHVRISNVRKDAQHKLTTWLAKNKSVIVVEDLNVRGMVKNRHLSRAVSDVGFRTLRKQLEYKTSWYGSAVIVADRFFPSSKMCSGCGYVKNNLKLSERRFVCDVCGVTVNRDLNASRNLEKLAVSWTERVNACERQEVHDVSQVPANEARTEHYLRITSR